MLQRHLVKNLSWYNRNDRPIPLFDFQKRNELKKYDLELLNLQAEVALYV